jgi:hypothetical protein
MTEASRTNTRCGDCGEPIAEPEEGEPKPCPKCGSTLRSLNIPLGELGTEFGATADAQETVQTEFILSYPQELMNLARRLIDEHRPSLAVIVVHMACEIATDRSISDAFDARGAQDLKDWVVLRLGYNLANKNVRRLYTALTGDRVADHVTSWSKFKSSAKLRNDIIHKGRIATEGEAEASYKAGSDLLEHLWSQKGARSLP